MPATQPSSVGGARPSRCFGAPAPLGITEPSASSFIGQTARHRRVLTTGRARRAATSYAYHTGSSSLGAWRELLPTPLGFNIG
jgi:hypothetical protein